MGEWLTYRPADFLLFSDRTYWRLFELENTALMPLPVLAPLIALGALLLARTRPAIGMPALAVVLAIAWGLTGASFVWQRYAPVNWAVAYITPLFLLEGLLLLGAAAGRAVAAVTRGSPARTAGFALLGYAVVVHPFFGLLAGRPLGGAEIVGIAPDPTAIATLGLALPLWSRWASAVILVFPAAWLAVSSLTLWVLGSWQTLVPILSLLTGAAALFLDRRWRRRVGQRSRLAGD